MNSRWKWMNRQGMVKAMARHVMKNWRNHPDADLDSFDRVFEELRPRYAAHEMGQFNSPNEHLIRAKLIYDAIEYCEAHPSEFDDVEVWEEETQSGV